MVHKENGRWVAKVGAVGYTFPDFAMADDTRWDAVIKRAKDGSADALVPLGHRGEVDEHPVPKAILAFLGAAGKRGSDVLRRFQDPPYGWPKDAIDGSLSSMCAASTISYVCSNRSPNRRATSSSIWLLSVRREPWSTMTIPVLVMRFLS